MARPQEDFALVLEPVERTRARLSELSRNGPSRDSQADKDARTKLGRMAWHLAVPAASIGVDHLFTWRAVRLGAALQPGFAHLTLIRAAMEGSAVARWICEATISGSERVRRAAGVQIEDYKQRISFERHMGAKPPPRGKPAVQRMEDLRSLLRLQHIEPREMPSATELFARYAFSAEVDPQSGEGFFRAISGVVHSKVWSLFGVSTLGDVVELDDERKAVSVSADDELAYLGTALAVRMSLAALSDIEQYGASAAA